MEITTIALELKIAYIHILWRCWRMGMTKEEFLNKVIWNKIYVGAKVKIRKDLVAGAYYGYHVVVPQMIEELKRLNHILTVEKIYNKGYFKVKESIYSYSKEMMED